jgi:hypothetical protein
MESSRTQTASCGFSDCGPCCPRPMVEKSSYRHSGTGARHGRERWPDGSLASRHYEDHWDFREDPTSISVTLSSRLVRPVDAVRFTSLRDSATNLSRRTIGPITRITLEISSNSHWALLLLRGLDLTDVNGALAGRRAKVDQMRFAVVSNARVAQVILIFVAMLLPIAALERRRHRRSPQVCRLCEGFGNTTGSADDVDTVCDACDGTGWTDPNGTAASAQSRLRTANNDRRNGVLPWNQVRTSLSPINSPPETSRG